jgi:hypothetical protein
LWLGEEGLNVARELDIVLEHNPCAKSGQIFTWA